MFYWSLKHLKIDVRKHFLILKILCFVAL